MAKSLFTSEGETSSTTSVTWTPLMELSLSIQSTSMAERFSVTSSRPLDMVERISTFSVSVIDLHILHTLVKKKA